MWSTKMVITAREKTACQIKSPDKSMCVMAGTGLAYQGAVCTYLEMTWNN
jgi:hypothetical protein